MDSGGGREADHRQGCLLSHAFLMPCGGDMKSMFMLPFVLPLVTVSGMPVGPRRCMGIGGMFLSWVPAQFSWVLMHHSRPPQPEG